MLSLSQLPSLHGSINHPPQISPALSNLLPPLPPPPSRPMGVSNGVSIFILSRAKRKSLPTPCLVYLDLFPPPSPPKIVGPTGPRCYISIHNSLRNGPLASCLGRAIAWFPILTIATYLTKKELQRGLCLSPFYMTTAFPGVVAPLISFILSRLLFFIPDFLYRILAFIGASYLISIITSSHHHRRYYRDALLVLHFTHLKFPCHRRGELHLYLRLLRPTLISDLL